MYLCLDQLHSLSSHGLEVAVHTQCALSLHLLHDSVQEDEGPSAAHPCTAVDQEGLVQAGWVLSADSPDEGDDGHGVARDSMVWPGSVVHVSHTQLSLWLQPLK